MASQSTAKPPKALLFDIGGVCVVSPFRAILDYEIAHRIPPGWVNFSISRTSPHGSWHQLERGEILLDAEFFKKFNADMRRPDLWREHVRRFKESLSQKTSSKSQNERERELAKFDVDETKVPQVDAEWLFWEMMRISRTPDPYMAPALQKLRASQKFLLGALSNTVVFPPDHEFNRSPPDDPRRVFDVFVSSAHSGVRKPAREAYDLAFRELQRKMPDLKPEEVLFLDDIGENLKGGKKYGFRTLRVLLGRTDEAVRELGEVVGMDLGGVSGGDAKL